MLGCIIERIFDSHKHGKFVQEPKCPHACTNYEVLRVRLVSVPLTNRALMWLIECLPGCIRQILVWAYYFFLKLQYISFHAIKEFCSQSFRHEAAEITYQCKICISKGSSKLHKIIFEKTCYMDGIIKMSYGYYNHILSVGRTIELTHHGCNLISNLERINGMHHKYCFMTSNCQHFARILLVVLEEREHSERGENIVRDVLTELSKLNKDMLS